jgi:hypothetical protein
VIPCSLVRFVYSASDSIVSSVGTAILVIPITLRLLNGCHHVSFLIRMLFIKNKDYQSNDGFLDIRWVEMKNKLLHTKVRSEKGGNTGRK